MAMARNKVVVGCQLVDNAVAFTYESRFDVIVLPLHLLTLFSLFPS